MPPNNPTEAQVFISIIGVVIAWLLYRMNVQQQRDAWLRTFKEMHEAFWNDLDMAEVRAWLACQTVYLEIEPILAKRKAIDEAPEDATHLTKDEYVVLEKLDKFFNLMHRTVAVINRVKVGHYMDLWQRFYVQYWLSLVDVPDRQLVHWYVNRFYSELSALRRSLMEKEGSEHSASNVFALAVTIGLIVFFITSSMAGGLTGLQGFFIGVFVVILFFIVLGMPETYQI
jgi:hypothetical protein